MDAEWKRKWVEALRSGDYAQGRSFLKMGDEYCCLGVLCDLMSKDGGLVKCEPPDTGIVDSCVWRFDGQHDYLPPTAQEIAGLESHNPRVNGEYLALLNDEGGLSFAEISDLIEKHL